MKKLVVTTAALVPLMGATAGAAPYTISKGDTLTGIGAKFHQNWQTIWRSNPKIANPNLIYAGQTIDIPDGTPTTLPVTGDTTVSSVHTFTCADARAIINQYDWPTQTAYNIMVAESSCNPGVSNMADSHGSCVGSFGLFQINCHHGRLYDPVQNVAQAYKMYKASGWSPWGFLTCKVKVAC